MFLNEQRVMLAYAHKLLLLIRTTTLDRNACFIARVLSVVLWCFIPRQSFFTCPRGPPELAAAFIVVSALMSKCAMWDDDEKIAREERFSFVSGTHVTVLI
jgi:hypothetical protein